MTVWIVFAFMTALAAVAVLWPFLRPPRLRANDTDRAVYRDQLQELERDVALGFVATTEAQAIRTELARRLLGADEEKPSVAERSRMARIVAVTAAAVALPAITLGVYLKLGSPQVPGQPFAERVARVQGQQSIVELVARVEEHLARNPQDGRGWEVLAPVYFRLGQFEDSVRARRNALAYAGETAERQADLGEALSAAAKGAVTAEAKSAFERALVLDPGEIKARYYLGLAAEQEGRREAAATIWRDMLAGAPADAGWADAVRAALARVTGETPSDASQTPPPARPSGPAVSGTEANQDEMVRGMVTRLASRLKSTGGDADDWGQLVRSYVVLGEHAKAREAARDGESALANDPERLARLRDLLKGLELDH